MDQAQISLIVGVIGAGGAILAGLLANISTQIVIFRKQDTRRWLERRADAVGELYIAAHAIWACYDYTTGDHDHVEGEYTRAAERGMAAFTQVIMLCQKQSTQDAAEELWDAMNHLEHRVSRSWDDVQRDIYVSALGFARAARIELGLKPMKTDATYEEWRSGISDVQVS